MAKDKIALTLIVKATDDEAEYLDKALRSVAKYVDGIFINVNHKEGVEPSQKVLGVCNKHKAEIVQTVWTDNFAEARNVVADIVPDDYKWILWIDSDDTLLSPHKLRKVAKNAHGVDAVYVDYLYDFDEFGNPITIHMSARLYRNNGSHVWKGRIHETLVETRAARTGMTKDIQVIHHADESKRDASLARNIKLLEMQLEDEKDEPDPRTLFYLAGSYIDAGEDDKALELYEAYVKMSGWDQERSQAYVGMARILKRKDMFGDARVCLLQALGEAPEDPEPYVELGQLEHELGNESKALTWLNYSLNIDVKPSTLVYNPQSVAYRANLLASEVCSSMGGAHLEKSLEYAEKALKTRPKDKLLLNYTNNIRTAVKHKAELKKIVQKVREANGDKAKTQTILSKVPQELDDNPIIVQLRGKFLPFTWPEKSIAIYTGEAAIGEWGPWSLADGIGGSEEAIIRISKHLKDLGYKVVIFGTVGNRAGDYDGVQWRNHWECQLDDNFDIFVAWRNPYLFDRKITARKVYLWLHDVMDKGEFTEERLANIDKVILLSKYHRTCYPMIPEDKVLYSGNGIDTEDFEEFDNIERDSQRVIYQSSHVRGLQYLYEIWPEVKKAVPKATLDVYYGWHSYDKINAGNPERMAWKERMVQLEKSLDGVTDHGKVGQRDIALAASSAGIWAYPCPFPEIYCHPAGTKVMTEFGEKNIEELLLTDRVLTHRGVLKPIYQTMRRKADTLIKLSVRSGDDLLLTPNHPVYTKRNGEYVWVEAGELTQTDVLLTPAELLETDYSWVNQSIFYIKDENTRRANNLPTEQHTLPEKLTITPKLAKFFGYFAGDGNANERGKVSVLVADKHPEHEQIALDGFAELGLAPDIAQKRGCKEYRVYSYELARAFRKYFYDGKKKKLPLAWAAMPEVLDGLLAADGHCKNGYNHGFTNTSDRLIGWVKIALAIRGYSGKAQKRVHKVGKDSWTISWTQEGKLPQYHKVGGFVEKKIKSINRIEHNDWVYNIEVEDDHSYVSNGSVVHNCITAVKAQAGGAVPVCSNYAALDEMVQYGEKLDMVPIDEGKLDEYKDRLIWWLQHPEEQEKQRKAMKEWARTLTWRSTAEGWARDFEL